MSWAVAFLPEASKDLDSLSRTQQTLVKKAIAKVRENPLTQNEGGYGTPLGYKRGLNLTNLLKIKLRDAVIRIIYKLIKTDTQMLIIVVGVRENEEVYEIAHTRRTNHDL